MSIQDAIAKASAKPAGKRPYVFAPEVERVLAITLAVSAELAVTRQRLDSLERLMARKDMMTRDEIEEFVPTDADHEERGLWNQEYVTRIFRIIQQEAEAVEGAAAEERTSEELHDELETAKA
jgi:hypothetical protein